MVFNVLISIFNSRTCLRVLLNRDIKRLISSEVRIDEVVILKCRCELSLI